jgi:DNA mismatch endonuclease (patch repair protein)
MTTRTTGSYPHPSSPAVTVAMRGNRRADTRPEIAIRSAIHARGLRFRKDHAIKAGEITVKADIVFTRRRVAVFIDGCFWHGCPQHGHTPRVNTHYWGPKLERNRQRDHRVTAALTADGWAVLRIWEHERTERAADLIVAAVGEDLTRAA